METNVTIHVHLFVPLIKLVVHQAMMLLAVQWLKHVYLVVSYRIGLNATPGLYFPFWVFG